MPKQYHCCYVNEYGESMAYVVHDTIAPVLELVKQADPDPGDGYPKVCKLVVIHGEKVEFEPAVVVKTYKVKGA